MKVVYYTTGSQNRRSHLDPDVEVPFDMRALPSRERSLIYIIHILMHISVFINAELFRIPPWEWDLYVQDNLEVFKTLLWEIGLFKIAREATCSIGGPNDSVTLDPGSPTSLYYSIGTLKVALAGFQTAISDAVSAVDMGLDPELYLEDFGFEDITSANASMIRLEKTVNAYEDMIATFLESGHRMDSFPSTEYPTISEGHNIRALSLFIEGASHPGANPEENVIIDSDSRSLFIDYWQTLFEEARRGRFLTIAGVALARKYFDVNGFTALIKHRSAIPQDSPLRLKVSSLLKRVELVLGCWMIRSQLVLEVLGKIGDIPEPILGPRWLVMLDGQEVTGV
ncbi:hypothetical protein TWF281_001836 [Arthrobotrys megalospora]